MKNLEILEYEVQPDDQYMVIASDGVWEFLPNEEVAKITYPFFQKSAPEAAANALVKESYKSWKLVLDYCLTRPVYRRKRS